MNSPTILKANSVRPSDKALYPRRELIPIAKTVVTTMGCGMVPLTPAHRHKEPNQERLDLVTKTTRDVTVFRRPSGERRSASKVSNELLYLLFDRDSTPLLIGDEDC